MNHRDSMIRLHKGDYYSDAMGKTKSGANPSANTLIHIAAPPLDPPGPLCGRVVRRPVWRLQLIKS